MSNQHRKAEWEAIQRAMNELLKGGLQLTETYKELEQKAAKLSEALNYDPEELKAMAGKKQNQLNNHDTINKDGKSTD